MSTPEITEKQGNGNHGRNPLLIIGGVIILGVAVALIFFGNTLFGPDNTEPGTTAAPLEQVPSFAEAESAMPQLPTGGGPLAVGDAAYDFTLQDLEGNEVGLQALHGRPVIVNFWATWCAPCRIEMPELQAAFEEYQDTGLVILALNQDEAPQTVRAFFYEEMELTFTPLLDEEGNISKLYGVYNFPSTFFINPDGRITAVHRGPMVRSQIDGYLAQTIPPG